MKIAVIIPTFNRPNETLRAIDSVLSQSHPVSEIFVVDDNSLHPFVLDDEKKKLVKVLRHDKNSGVSSARNTGVMNAKSEWLAFLDSDDEWCPNKIEKQVQDQKNNPDLLFFYTEENWLKDGKIINKKKHQSKHSGWIFEDCLKQCFVGASTSLIHRSIFTDVGIFDPKLTVCEDYDYWIRVSHKYKMFLNPEPLVTKHGGHKDQLSMKYFAMDYYRLLSLVKVFKTIDLSLEQKEAVKKQIKKKVNLLKAGAKKHDNHKLLGKLKDIETFNFCVNM